MLLSSHIFSTKLLESWSQMLRFTDQLARGQLSVILIITEETDFSLATFQAYIKDGRVYICTLSKFNHETLCAIIGRWQTM